jgi:Transposase DDE domain
LIREQGLKERMELPEKFINRMNCLCIVMANARRKPDSKKQRKGVLRAMKRLVKAVEGHARRYRDLLDREWEKTEWTRKQAEQVLRRLDGVLKQMPAATKQAHERIIGERPVKNADKILSLYETDLHVIVRGKADAEVEFGNLLVVSENLEGLIVDFQLFKDKVPADVTLLPQSVERIEQAVGQEVKELGGDRGFDSEANRECLKEKNIYNGICPKGPEELKKRRKQKKFVALQTRRSQTEARIAILKNNFLGRPLRAKGFENRERAVAWAVLAHNLWVMARLPQPKKKEKKRKAA